jgi:hypothetical protein
MPREGSIVKGILAALNAIPDCIARKRGPGSITGDPDIYGCYRGLHFELEVKQPGKQPTRIQAYRLSQWEKTRAITAVVSSTREALDVVLRFPSFTPPTRGVPGH